MRSLNRTIKPAFSIITSHKRLFIEKLPILGQKANLITGDNDFGKGIALWTDEIKPKESALVLDTRERIEEFVIRIIKDYHTTTNKEALEMESLLFEHGLDSLDCIELVMEVEDQLGILIEGENLEKFRKPKHFVNFIYQMECFKRENFNKYPHEDVHPKFNAEETFPIHQKIKNLFKKKKK